MGEFGHGSLCGEAQIWSAITPYVTPNWRLTKTGKERAAFTPDVQLKKEAASMGLPDVKHIDWQPFVWLGEDRISPQAFMLERTSKLFYNTPPKDAVAAFPTVHFEELVAGPLAFGYGSHFGLGLMRPVG